MNEMEETAKDFDEGFKEGSRQTSLKIFAELEKKLVPISKNNYIYYIKDFKRLKQKFAGEKQ